MDPQKNMRKLIVQTTSLAVLFMIIGGVILSITAIKRTEKILLPQISAKEMIISNLLNELITTALTNGYPADRLTGLDSYFSEIRSENKEISYIALVDKNSKLLYLDGDPCTDLSRTVLNLSQTDSAFHFATSNCLHSGYPVTTGKSPKLFLFLGINKSIFWSSIKASLLDSITFLIVSLLVIVEFTMFLINRSLMAPLSSIYIFIDMIRKGVFTHTLKPLSGDEKWEFATHINKLIEQVNKAFHQLNPASKKLYNEYTFCSSEDIQPLKIRTAIDGRLPLFLIVFADALSLSFLPLYVTTISTHVSWLPDKFLAALPITIFMLFWAISLPYAGAWSDRKGRDIPLLSGACITAIGLIGTGSAHTIYDLLLWRAVTAIGYGIVYITSQGYIMDTTSKEKRTQGMAMFLSAFFAGSLCGSAIGGIIAERFGFRITFYFSSLIAMAAAMCVLTRLSSSIKQPISDVKKITFKDVKTVMKNSHFLSVLFFSAIPAKICLVGFIYYTVPILLKSYGTNQSTIGRVIMAYGLPIVIFSPLIAKFADKIKNRARFIITGGYLSALSLFIVYWIQGLNGILAATILLGVAHSISVSSQIVFVTDVFSRKNSYIGLGSVIALFRLVERSGNIIGPILAGFLISIFGFNRGVVALGILTLTGTILFWISSKLNSPTTEVELP